VRRVPLTLRALLLVPLLAVAVDLARTNFACGPGAESCLEAAGRGWIGPAGTVLLVLYALALSLGIARIALGTAGRTPRLWAVGTLGVAAVCGGQALLAGAMGDPAALGGGWLELLALCGLAGGVIAAALRVAPAAVALVRSLRPRAPRVRVAAIQAVAAPVRAVRRIGTPFSPATAGRAPPALTHA
jgi:hypothetical protein